MSTVQGGADGKSPRGTRKLHPAVRSLLGLAAVLFLAAAGILWLSPSPATVRVTTQTRLERTVAPRTKHHRSLAQRTTKHTTTATHEVLSGRSDQLKHAQPAGAAATRSEAITIVLVTAALLLAVLAAMPTLPSKLGFGVATAEWTPEEIVQAAATASAAASSAGVDDPRVVGNLARAVVNRAASVKAAAPDARVDWSHVAEAALREVLPADPAKSPERDG